MTNAILSFFGSHPRYAWTLTFAIIFAIAGIVVALVELKSAPEEK